MPSEPGDPRICQLGYRPSCLDVDLLTQAEWEDILEGEGPGVFRKRPAACPTWLGLGSPPPPEPKGQVNITWKLSWERLITSMLHDEASPFLEFILAN